MHLAADISTIELARTRLRLRDDVRVSPQLYAGEPFCHLELKSSSRYFRIGWNEYIFVSLLNGETTFAEALAVSSQSLADQALSQQRATQLYSWLLDNGLATLADDDARSSGAETTTRKTRSSGDRMSRWNPLWCRIPLCNPDAALKVMSRWLGWLVSPMAFIPGMILAAIAVVMLSQRWSEFVADAAGIVSPHNWLWLAVIGVVLKLCHEAGHGLVCQRYGGAVSEAGVVVAMLTPLPYVEASTAWSFRSRWQRIHTALAGVQVELLIASVATIAWSFADSGFARQLLQNIVVMSSLSTIVFNLNPLMKFDGYFVLSDGLQIPNLAAEASSELHRLGRRLFFGDVSSAPRIAGGRRWIVLGYGMCAAMWRLVMSVSLLLAASILAQGAGLILAAVGLVMWFGKPAAQFTKMIWAMRLESPERLIRAVLVFSSLLLATTAAAVWLPAPVLTVAPGVVEYVDAEMIRAETEGFVSQVHVNDGDTVQPGSVLVTLRNDDIQSELTSARKRLDQETLRMKSAASTHDAPAVSIAVGNLESLRKQVSECQRRVDGLSLRATRNGHVSARTLHQLPGTWLNTGTLVAIVGDPSRKEMRASVGQRELSRSLSLIGEPVRVRAGDQSVVSGTLVRVDPQGSRDLSEQSLAATNGGPLEVEEATERDGDQQERKMRLTEHRFQAVVSLDPSVAQQFHCGQRGQVTLGASDITLGRLVWRATNQWFREKLNVTESSR